MNVLSLQMSVQNLINQCRHIKTPLGRERKNQLILNIILMADMLSDVVCSDLGKQDHEKKNNASALEQPEAAQNLENVEQEADPQRVQQ